jgi:hypothetical protein
VHVPTLTNELAWPAPYKNVVRMVARASSDSLFPPRVASDLKVKERLHYALPFDVSHRVDAHRRCEKKRNTKARSGTYHVGRAT